MRPRERSSSHHGKAEWGLLLALLIFCGGVATVVWLVIAGHDETMVARPPIESPPPKAPRPPVVKAPALSDADGSRSQPKPPLAGSSPTVTILPDPKAREALASLRRAPTEGSRQPGAKPSASTTIAEGGPSNSNPDPKPAPLDLDGEPVDRESPEVKTAAEVLRRFQSVRTWQEKLAFVYQPRQVEPLMHEYYGSQNGSDPKLTGLIASSNLKIGDRRVLSLVYACEDRLDLAAYVSFHRTPDGLRLDWESLVGFSGTTLSAFRASRSPKPTEFRLLALLDDYYNYEFADAGQFLSVRLYRPDGQDYLHGYCRKNSEDGHRLLAALGLLGGEPSAVFLQNRPTSAKQAYAPITVLLAFPPEAKSDRCVQIEKFIAGWWLAPVEAAQTVATQPTDATSVR